MKKSVFTLFIIIFTDQRSWYLTLFIHNPPIALSVWLSYSVSSSVYKELGANAKLRKLQLLWVRLEVTSKSKNKVHGFWFSVHFPTPSPKCCVIKMFFFFNCLAICCYRNPCQKSNVNNLSIQRQSNNFWNEWEFIWGYCGRMPKHGEEGTVSAGGETSIISWLARKIQGRVKTLNNYFPIVQGSVCSIQQLRVPKSYVNKWIFCCPQCLGIVSSSLMVGEVGYPTNKVLSEEEKEQCCYWQECLKNKKNQYSFIRIFLSAHYVPVTKLGSRETEWIKHRFCP